MKLYYHKTDGGAEYYSLTYTLCPDGHKEGTIPGVVMRTDGKELEIFADNLKDHDIKLVVHGYMEE